MNSSQEHMFLEVPGTVRGDTPAARVLFVKAKDDSRLYIQVLVHRNSKRFATVFP